MRVALLDANVLHPISLTDLLLCVAEVGGYEPRWSADIHAEWTRSVLATDPRQTGVKLARRRATMDAVFPQAVVTGYESLAADLTLPDPADRHVLAAAIVGQADTLVTFNLRDFPADLARSYRTEVLHPQPFLLDVLAGSPTAIIAALAWATGRAGRLDALDRLNLPEVSRLLPRLATG